MTGIVFLQDIDFEDIKLETVTSSDITPVSVNNMSKQRKQVQEVTKVDIAEVKDPPEIIDCANHIVMKRQCTYTKDNINPSTRVNGGTNDQSKRKPKAKKVSCDKCEFRGTKASLRRHTQVGVYMYCVSKK